MYKIYKNDELEEGHYYKRKSPRFSKEKERLLSEKQKEWLRKILGSEDVK